MTARGECDSVTEQKQSNAEILGTIIGDGIYSANDVHASSQLEEIVADITTAVKSMLLAYSEWLDADQGIMLPDPGDKDNESRLHAELVHEFLVSK